MSMLNSEITEEEISKIVKIVTDLVLAMGFEGKVDVEQTVTKGLVVNVDIGNDSFWLIGKRGASLHALENLAQTLVTKALAGKFIRFSLDCDDYRRKREWYLKETVIQALDRARATQRPVALMSMPNYERRFVHALVQTLEPNAITTSTGFEPDRRVVIKLG